MRNRRTIILAVLGAATVVIQHTRVGSSRFRGWGGPAPYAYSTGSGRAVVLRDGRRGRPTGPARTARVAPRSPLGPGGG